MSSKAGLAIFLDGPIGAGKTTLGRLLAARLQAGFVDGDDHHVAGRGWFGSSLTTGRGVLKAALAAMEGNGGVVIAYPLRCLNWVFYKEHLARAGATTVFVGLTASAHAIVEPGRCRLFSDAERARIGEIIAQGYGRRFFHHLRIDTGGRPVAASLEELEAGVRKAAAQPC